MSNTESSRQSSHLHPDSLPVSPSLESTLSAEGIQQPPLPDAGRMGSLLVLALTLGVAGAFLSQGLTALIALFSNLAFYGRFSFELVSLAHHRLGRLVLVVPVLGAAIIGLMARYGSAAIRGHGIPEAMEQVLTNESRIPPRITFLKPLSAAIAIGTGGPFGAEGPIIATGGALGSLVGQLLRSTAVERKILLACGAAAGMAATFGTPAAAVLLAVELLLFELRPRSIIPVAVATVTATGVRYALLGSEPVFPMPDLAAIPGPALLFYTALGAGMGVVSVAVTRLVYAIEDGFERLPIHWMWWPMLGAVAVGLVGLVAPRTLGVGYENIEEIVSGKLVGTALLFLCGMKLLSWAVYLGSGTSGGTLAPLFTIGGGLGAVLSGVVAHWFPQWGIDPRIGGLVGMAAIFAGASRALLASVVFAFETTRQPMGLLPLLGGCTTAYLISYLSMRNTIMTEKIVRRGVRVPSEYVSDYLDQVQVGAAASRPVVSLGAEETLERVREWLNREGREAHHQGFPVLDAAGTLIGVVTRRDLLNAQHSPSTPVGDLVHRRPVVIFEDCSLREAADLMVRQKVGRLPVVSRSAPGTVAGIITRSDLLGAHQRRLDEAHTARRTIRLRSLIRRRLNAGRADRG